MICCIPSKGRPNTKTHELFKAAGIEVYHFIEPQELSVYNHLSNVVNIEENNRGVAYVRNFILDWARENHHEWIVTCDDDINSFGLYDGKNNRRDGGIWLEILKKVQSLPFELVGINKRMHAWHEKNFYTINRNFAEGCVLQNAPKIKWKYKEGTKEDRDFFLQTIQKGYGSIRFGKYFFDTPVVGSNKGGLNEEYSHKKDTDWAIKIVQDWHPYAKLMKTKSGRVDAKIDIKAFSKANSKIIK